MIGEGIFSNRSDQMEVYKYLNSSAAQKFLENWSIGFSHPIELNDPFEFLPIYVKPSEDERRQAIEQCARNYAERNKNTTYEDALGLAKWTIDRNEKMNEGEIRSLIKDPLFWVTCFSRTETNLLMWSHYAGESGIVVEIDTDSPLLKDRLRPVLYSQKQPKFDVRTFKTTDSPQAPFFAKSLDWAYEQEERIVISAIEAQKLDGANKLKINRSDGSQKDLLLIPITKHCVRRIIFGTKFLRPAANRKLAAELMKNDETHHIILNMAHIDPEEYRINCTKLLEKFIAT